MNPIELLRFGWKPNELRLLIAALADAGPVSARVWRERTQIPRSDHLALALAECQRLGGLKVEQRPEGLALWVQPVEFWRAKPLCDSSTWALAWARCAAEQARLALATEAPGLAEAMAVSNGSSDAVSSGFPEFGRSVSRNPGDVPGIREGKAALCTRVEVIENKESSSRVHRDRGEGTERTYVLEKLRRIPKLEREVTRPSGAQQERISRLFWELLRVDPEWLKAILGDLADRTDLLNKAAWFNRAATQRLGMAELVSRDGDEGG